MKKLILILGLAFIFGMAAFADVGNIKEESYACMTIDKPSLAVSVPGYTAYYEKPECLDFVVIALTETSLRVVRSRISDSFYRKQYYGNAERGFSTVSALKWRSQESDCESMSLRFTKYTYKR